MCERISVCVCIYVSWLCACTHRGQVECRKCFLPILCSQRNREKASWSQCISTIVSLLFVGGRGGEICFCAKVQRHLPVSSVTNFPTKHSLSPAAIPGPGIAWWGRKVCWCRTKLYSLHEIQRTELCCCLHFFPFFPFLFFYFKTCVFVLAMIQRKSGG